MEDHECQVVEVRDVGPETIAVEIETPPAFDAQPGQFVKLTVSLDGDEESRFYTISSPDVESTFEITVSIDPEGIVGPVLAELEPGDVVRVTGPFGNDYYEREPRAVVVAGGPGVGPAVGIAERARDVGNDAAVVYRNGDPIHEDRLDALAGAGVPVHVLEADEPLEDAVADALAEGGQIFVYGFADFVDDALDAIGAAGGDTEGAKIENFG